MIAFQGSLVCIFLFKSNPALEITEPSKHLGWRGFVEVTQALSFLLQAGLFSKLNQVTQGCVPSAWFMSGCIWIWNTVSSEIHS